MCTKLKTSRDHLICNHFSRKVQKSGSANWDFFFWSTTFLELDFSNQISRTTFLEPLFYTFLEKWLQIKWSFGSQELLLYYFFFQFKWQPEICFQELFVPNKFSLVSPSLIQQLVPNIWLFLVPRGSDSLAIQVDKQNSNRT